MPRPRFKLIHLVALVAASAICLGALKSLLGLALFGTLVVAGAVAGFSKRPTRADWVAILVILAILAALLLPAT